MYSHFVNTQSRHYKYMYACACVSAWVPGSQRTNAFLNWNFECTNEIVNNTQSCVFIIKFQSNHLSARPAKSTQITHSKAKADGIWEPFRMAFLKNKKKKKERDPCAEVWRGAQGGALVKRGSAQTAERTTDWLTDWHNYLTLSINQTAACVYVCACVCVCVRVKSVS